jgi:hypothetical protein
VRGTGFLLFGVFLYYHADRSLKPKLQALEKPRRTFE